MIDTKLQEKILKVINEHYKEDGQKYDSFLLYTFVDDKDGDMAMRAIFHKISAVKMMGAEQNLRDELEDTLKDAYQQFKYSQMH